MNKRDPIIPLPPPKLGKLFFVNNLCKYSLRMLGAPDRKRMQMLVGLSCLISQHLILDALKVTKVNDSPFNEARKTLR